MTTTPTRIGRPPTPGPGRCPTHGLDLNRSGVCPSCRADALAGHHTADGPLVPAPPSWRRTATTPKETP